MDTYQSADRSDTVNDEELRELLSERLEETCLPQSSPSPRCIYTTPKLLRTVNEASYTPRLVSIGPSHYVNEDFRMIEKVKNRYLRKYFNSETLSDIITYMKGCVEKLKSCYAETTFHLGDTSYVEMMLLDGVFIIELFLRMTYPDLVESSDVILLQSIDLKNDLFFMLENQLPWFFIQDLYDKYVIQHVPDQTPFLDLALSICSRHVPWYCPDIDMIRELRVEHLHDLVRTTIIHPLPSHIIHPLLSHAHCLQSAHQRLSATVLHEAGVKFKVRESKSYLDIIFDKGALHMPSFTFDRNTETLARNLMAYEQCHYQDYPSLTYLCDYFCLMDSLINTSKDVDLLVKSGIIINWLGDNDEVATLVNNLFKHVQIDANLFCYAKLCEDLDKHCRSRWNIWKSTFKRDYLSTPWKAASTAAAIILLVLTSIQTWYSVKK